MTEVVKEEIKTTETKEETVETKKKFKPTMANIIKLAKNIFVFLISLLVFAFCSIVIMAKKAKKHITDNHVKKIISLVLGLLAMFIGLMLFWYTLGVILSWIFQGMQEFNVVDGVIKPLTFIFGIGAFIVKYFQMRKATAEKLGTILESMLQLVNMEEGKEKEKLKNSVAVKIHSCGNVEVKLDYTDYMKDGDEKKLKVAIEKMHDIIDSHATVNGAAMALMSFIFLEDWWTKKETK